MKTLVRGVLAALFALTAVGCGTGTDVMPPDPPAQGATFDNVANGVINTWSINTSEEYQPVGCGAGNLIPSMRCTGSYCDNVGIYCSSQVATFGDQYWTSYFSEESTNYRTCNSGYWMTGLVCRGSNCDDISIQCTRVTNRGTGTCRWADRTFSEEFPNTYNSPAGWFARGLACSGSKCDNLRIYECPLL